MMPPLTCPLLPRSMFPLRRTVLLPTFLVLGLAILGWSAPAAAQAPPFQRTVEGEWIAPRWMGDVAFLSTNALTGGVAAGVLRRMEGGRFRDGFAAGTLGGATAYLGRRVAAEEFDGAGLVGRQISGVGASMVRNAGEGRPLLDHLIFPVGPLRLHVDRGQEEGIRVHPRVSAHDLAWTVGFVLSSDTEFDLSSSLSAGAPVFRAPQRQFRGPDGGVADGISIAGVVGLADVPQERLRTVFPHERVHVLQYDFGSIVWGDPVERRILERHRWGREASRWVAPSVVFPAARGGFYRLLGVEHRNQPAEIEAKFLDRGRR